MPIKSRFTTPIPPVSLPTFLFTSPTTPLPTTPLLIDARTPQHALSASTYRLWCQRFAAGLRAAGLQPGDRVLLFSGNNIFFPVVLLGTIMAGGVFSGANPNSVARELAHQLRDSGARFLLTAPESADTATKAAQEVGVPLDRVFVFDDGRDMLDGKAVKGVGELRHWSHLIADEATGAAFVWEDFEGEESAQRIAALNYSSGTTGVPKGVMITHRNYIANACQMEVQARMDAGYPTRQEKWRYLCFLPMYHAMAQTIFGINAIKQGVRTYIMPKFDFLAMLDNVQKYRITYLTVVPPIVVAMVKDPRVRNYDLSSIERVGSGAAPLGREVCVELEKILGGRVNVKQGWGMTEITCSAIGWDPNHTSTSFSVGELNANCEARIMNEDATAEVPRGQRGEIWVRAPNVMKGYWGRPEATAETLTPDGWLKTGDIAFVNEEGRFFIVDRKKELIKVKGNQVAPAELEALLLDHEAVADVAVIGVPDASGHDEQVRAYIVRRAGSSVSESDIQEWMKKHVTRTKWLTGGVRFVDAIPKNPSGKIMRRVLRDQAKAEADAEGAKAKL